MKNKVSTYSFDYKSKRDKNGNTRYSLFYNGKFIAGTNSLGVSHDEEPSNIVNELILYSQSVGTKLQKSKLSRCRDKTLSDAIGGLFELSSKDLDSIYSMLNARSSRIMSVLQYGIKSVKLGGLAERVYFCRHTGQWSYCAGQDYPYELATIRRELNR